MTTVMTTHLPVLSVRNLSVRFTTRRGVFNAISDVSFDLRPGSTLSVVGESGSGKSVTAMALMRLLPDAARVTGGAVRFEGSDLGSIPERQMRKVRGRRMAMVFQDPMASLNPLFSVGYQLCEPLILSQGLGRRAAQIRACELLRLVRIPSPDKVMRAYPHELSGGMRQRVMIAMALSCEPSVLIADEPTTALDVTTQSQILDLLRDLQRQMHMAVLLITHDLGVVAEYADDVVVMYAGRIVERATAPALFARPGHPYTEGLLQSMPGLEDNDPDILPAIEGNAASPFALPPGCAFHPRCRYAFDACRSALPPFFSAAVDQDVACLRR